MSTIYSGSLTGIHPFSETTIQKIFDYKYGRADKSQAVIQLEKDYVNLIALEKQGKWKYISTGNIGWYDLLRPFSENLKGLAPVSKTDDLPVTRNPLTNTFFRQAKITNSLEASETTLNLAKHPFLENGVLQTKFLPSEDKGKTWTQILPGPFYFANMCAYTEEGRKLYPKNSDAATAFAQCLEKIIINLTKIGFNAIILDESPIVWGERTGKPLTQDEILSAITILNDLQTKVKLPLIIHLFNGNVLQVPKNSLKSILEFFIESKVAGIGIDFISTTLSEVTKLNLKNKLIFAGLINAQGYSRRQDGSVVLENPKDLVRQLGMISKAGAKEVVLCPNTRLEFLPRSIADQKIEIINKAIGGI